MGAFDDLIPGGAGGSTKAPTEAQAKAGGYYQQMRAAAEAMNKIKDYDPNELETALDNGGGFFGFGRRAIKPEAQRALAAQRAFANSLLRFESGAAISQGEIDNRMRILFPQPSDGPEGIKDKQNQRQAAMDAMRLAAGPTVSNVPKLPARVRHDSDYKMLPKGARYIGPDGIERVK